MNCPKCKIELNCGCPSCRARSPHIKNFMINTGPNSEKCPGCGLDMSLDQWFDVAWKQYKEWKEKQNER